MTLPKLPSTRLLLATALLFVLSCKKDIKDDPTPEVPGNVYPMPTPTPVAGSVSGLVVDENNSPVEAAVIRLGTAQTTTDARGQFSFLDKTLDKYVTTVTVEKAGYFKGIRAFSATASMNFVTLKLIPKALSGTVSSSSGGTISLSNGTAISFQPNSIVVDGTGAAYAGTVNVYASYIDPTSPDISAILPGSFMGRDADNMYVLQSTGMIAVELTSPGGQALQLASALPATINLPIPAALQDRAPATIATWSLNDQGVWSKEGVANRSANHYEMQVTHFSFWNADIPTNTIFLTLHVQDQNGNALSNTLVELTAANNPGWWGTSYGQTDAQGNVSGFVPAAEGLILSVMPDPLNCNTATPGQAIGPFTANTSLTITVTIPSQQLLTVNGTAVNCNNQPLVSGIAVIYTSSTNYTYATVTNGAYNASLTSCNPMTQVEVTILDTANTTQGNSGVVTVTGSSITVPTVTACSAVPGAVFIINGGVGPCQAGPLTGSYVVGIALVGSAVAIPVEVQVPGTYNISTPITNGFSFSGTGTFTTTGAQFVTLTGSGTPVNTGTFLFPTQSNGIMGCHFPVIVTAQQGPLAAFNIGDPATCGSISVTGTYDEGSPLNATNTVVLTLNVTSPGAYSISSATIGGITFSGTGTLTTVGMVQVVLSGSGTASNAGTYTFQLQASNGSNGCGFDVVVTPVTGPGGYTFDGSPLCTTALLSGTYSAGVAMTSQNTVDIGIIAAGNATFSVVTNTANGVTFSGQGNITGTGAQIIILTATGTPTIPGIFTFTAMEGGTFCDFVVMFN